MVFDQLTYFSLGRQRKSENMLVRRRFLITPKTEARRLTSFYCVEIWCIFLENNHLMFYVELQFAHMNHSTLKFLSRAPSMDPVTVIVLLYLVLASNYLSPAHSTRAAELGHNSTAL